LGKADGVHKDVSPGPGNADPGDGSGKVPGDDTSLSLVGMMKLFDV
jgi:hypothetical protein